MFTTSCWEQQLQDSTSHWGNRSTGRLYMSWTEHMGHALRTCGKPSLTPLTLQEASSHQELYGLVEMHMPCKRQLAVVPRRVAGC